MSSLPDLLQKLCKFLKTSAVFSSFPLSLLLIGSEAVMDQHFSCPCRSDLNALLTASIFTGPALFTFALMFRHLRPLTHGWFHCPEGVNDDTQKNCFKVLTSCLIPPVMWIFVLLLDGDYVACSMTDWKGVYVFDKELNTSWCKPAEGTKNEAELRDLTRKYIHQSQVNIIFCMTSQYVIKEKENYMSFIWSTKQTTHKIQLIGIVILL